MADQTICQQIICGAITQAQAGIPLMLECAEAGYIGAQPCNADVCQPWVDDIEANMGGACPGNVPVDNAPNPLPEYVTVNVPPTPIRDTFTSPVSTIPTMTPESLLIPLPSITQPHRVPSMIPRNPQQFNDGDGGGLSWCGINQYVSDNPIAAALVVTGVYLLLSNKGK